MKAQLWWLGLLALLFVACGGGSSSTPTPTPTASPTATPIPPTPTSTPRPPATPAEPSVGAPQATCSDPYPGGAPFEPEQGEPILLGPTGQPPALARYQPLPFATDQALARVVQASMGQDARRIAVVVKNLADGRGVAIAADRTFNAASLYKTWVLVETYHQREAGLLDFDERYIISDYYEEEFGLNPGELATCDEVTIDHVLEHMIRASDNVAAHLMLDRLGAGNINTTLRTLGLDVSGYLSGLPTTAADMALVLEAIARRQVVSGAASDEMLELLSTTYFADRLVALLPEGTRVAHKTGNSENATHDAGIVFSPGATYVIVILTDFGFDDDGATPIARLSRAVYDYYNGQ
jgi:beta-lactamase class A